MGFFNKVKSGIDKGIKWNTERVKKNEENYERSLENTDTHPLHYTLRFSRPKN